MPEEIDVTKCPDCDQTGRYDGRVLIAGRGIYTCPDGHRWQDFDEAPSAKGIPLRPPYPQGPPPGPPNPPRPPHDRPYA